MNEVELYKKVLRLRTLFKNVNQVSWNISQTEKRFPFEGATTEELQGLHDIYVENADWLQNLLDEIRKQV